MSRTQTISLGNYWNEFIDQELAIGRYNSASEIMRDALRLLEEREASSKLEVLRAALIEGEVSGNAGKINMKQIKNQAKAKTKK